MIRMNSSIGLDIGHDSVKVVELGKFAKRIRLVKFGEEKIIPTASSPEPTVAAIRWLFERLRIKNKDVVIHLGGVGVRYLVLGAPLLPPSELLDWIQRNCTERLPKTANVATLIFSYHILQLILVNKRTASEEQIFALSSQFAVHAQLQKEQAQLQQALADVQRLVTQRGQYAQLLAEVSRVMPVFQFIT